MRKLLKITELTRLFLESEERKCLLKVLYKKHLALKTTCNSEVSLHLLQPRAGYRFRNVFLPLCSFFLSPKEKQTEACLVLKQSRGAKDGEDRE